MCVCTFSRYRDAYFHTRTHSLSFVPPLFDFHALSLLSPLILHIYDTKLSLSLSFYLSPPLFFSTLRRCVDVTYRETRVQVTSETTSSHADSSFSSRAAFICPQRGGSVNFVSVRLPLPRFLRSHPPLLLSLSFFLSLLLHFSLFAGFINPVSTEAPNVLSSFCILCASFSVFVFVCACV